MIPICPLYVPLPHSSLPYRGDTPTFHSKKRMIAKVILNSLLYGDRIVLPEVFHSDARD